MTILTPTSGHSHWIGFQALFGFRLGLAIQQPSRAAQAVLPKPNIPIGYALMFFSQQLGGAVFLVVGKSALLQELVKRLSSIPNLDAQIIAHTGATEIRNIIPAIELPAVLEVYNSP